MFFKESIEVHDTLNPKLWDKDNKLKEDVYGAIIDIITQFIDELEENEIPIKVLDAHVVGSNASFNYTADSDLDIHIIVNLDELSCDAATLNTLYMFFKSYFNDKYEITIKDIPVELYIEDIHTSTNSRGVYSIFKDEWIKFPKKEDIPDVDIDNLLSKYEITYAEVEESEDAELAGNLIDELYLLRKASIEKYGEYGEGNLVFKEFRNLGYLDKLKEIRDKGISKELSLEGLKEKILNKDMSESIDDNANKLAREIVTYYNNTEHSDKLYLSNSIPSNLNEHGAFFILPNGEFFYGFYNHVDVEEILQVLGKSNYTDVEDYIDYNILIYNSTFQDLGSIRGNINKYSTYLELPKKLPARVQFDKIEDILDYIQTHNTSKSVEISIYDTNTHNTYNFSEYTTDDIIKKIKRYYSSGKLYEAVERTVRNALNAYANEDSEDDTKSLSDIAKEYGVDLTKNNLNEDAESGDWGYHYGDLGKADYKHQFGDRNTGGFGTGIYFVGTPVSQRKDSGSYKNRPEHKIDFSKYNLFRPRNNEQAYKLHDTLLAINNMAPNFKRVPKQWDEVLDEFDKVFDDYYAPLNALDDDDYTTPVELNKKALEQYIRKYIDYYPHKIEKDDDLMDIAREIENNLKDEAKEFYYILSSLSSALGYYNEDKLRKIVIDALQDKSDIAPATLIMKSLGYEGIDVRHLDHDAQGLSGLDNFGFGSVIYDLKESIADDKTDSNGKPLSDSQIAYFKDSKVRDSSGRLLPVYHGTKDDFTVFKHGHMNRHDSGYLGDGFYFTDNLDSANSYSKWKRGNDYNSHTMEVYLNITNPLVLEHKQWATVDLQDFLGLDLLTDDQKFDFKVNQEISNKLTKEVQKRGYDGIIYHNDFYDETIYVIYDSNQIKSVTNETPTSSDDINESVYLHVNESLLTEAKEDKQKLIDFVGNDYAEWFFALKDKNKLKPPYNDIYYWLKKKPQELRDYILYIDIKPSKSEQRRSEKSGAKLVYNKNGWKIYRIDTYASAKYYGKGTKWCISGNYDGHEEQGESYFNDYKTRGVNDYYFIINPDNHKWCYLDTEDNFGDSVLWDEEDNGIDDIYDDTIPNIPQDALKVLPNIENHLITMGPIVELIKKIKSDNGLLTVTKNVRDLLMDTTTEDINELKKYITKIRVQGDIERIDAGLFSWLNVKKVVVEDGITTIENGAFHSCKYMDYIRLPETLTTIYTGAFVNCISLRKIYIPSSVKYIEDYAFLGCDNLTISCGVSEDYADDRYGSFWNVKKQLWGDSVYNEENLIPVIYNSNRTTPTKRIEEEKVNKSIYYRIEVEAPYHTIFGIFNGIGYLNDELEDAHDDNYFELYDLIYDLSDVTPIPPDNINLHGTKFAYTELGYDRAKPIIDDISNIVSKYDWKVIITQIPKPKNIVYSDEVQIAYID